MRLLMLLIKVSCLSFRGLYQLTASATSGWSLTKLRT
jgi:hypothetical protein